MLSDCQPNLTVNPWVKKYADIVPQGEVLDLACGNGRNGRYFLNRGYRVTFLDRDVSRLADLHDHPMAKVLAFDLEARHAWPFEPGKFCAVLVVNYLYRPLFSRLYESLKTGGVLIYQTFAEGNQAYGRPANPDFLLQPDELLHQYQPIMEVTAFTQGFEPDPPSVRQSLCAIKKE